ncbi:hypothetical protein [Nocardia brevicatena]|uniref:hypothetical protein n=1 Tax=Nocardia brevicatena TaxID=37327 RepID=UPI00031DE000|nr:hypothetical protein [Nocardia brevicatena]
MIDTWPGVVNTILYHIRFENELNQDIVDRISNALLTEPVFDLTPDEEYSALRYGLLHVEPLPTAIEVKWPATEIREFLTRVVHRMDELRPWPELPYLRLSKERMGDFMASARPIARIHTSFPNVESRVKRNFYYNPANGAFLLLRMKSGVELGFFSPYWDESYDTMLATNDESVSFSDVVNELVPNTDLTEDMLTPLLDPNRPTHLHPLYRTTELQPEFQGENLPGNPVWNGKQVRYLNAEERLSFRIHVHNGILYNNDGQPIDTMNSRTLWTPGGGRAIFVMDSVGNIYSSPYHILGEFHHSSFLAGMPVAGAGELQVAQGRVQLISDHSTHYRPARYFTRQVVDNLRRQGVHIDDRQVEYHSPPDIP